MEYTRSRLNGIEAVIGGERIHRVVLFPSVMVVVGIRTKLHGHQVPVLLSRSNSTRSCQIRFSCFRVQRDTRSKIRAALGIRKVTPRKRSRSGWITKTRRHRGRKRSRTILPRSFDGNFDDASSHDASRKELSSGSSASFRAFIADLSAPAATKIGWGGFYLARIADCISGYVEPHSCINRNASMSCYRSLGAGVRPRMAGLTAPRIGGFPPGVIGWKALGIFKETVLNAYRTYGKLLAIDGQLNHKRRINPWLVKAPRKGISVRG